MIITNHFLKYSKKLLDRLPRQLDAARPNDYQIRLVPKNGLSFDGLWVDGMVMKRVAAEIVRNAFKYGAHQVTIRLDRSGDRIEARFEDNGPGVPAEMLKRGRLFDYGVTTDGTGMGLYEARELARAHGGEQQGELRQCAGRGGQHGLPRGGGALHRGRFARRGRAGVSGQRRARYPAGTFPHAGMLRLRLPHGGQRGHPPAGRRRAAPLVRGQARRFAGRARVGGERRRCL